MHQYLIDHAFKNVWCNPEQDNQLLIAATRITKALGELNRFKIMNRVLPLPNPNKRYHVFQVGQLHPTLAGLLNRDPSWTQETWIPFSEAINKLKLFMSLYTATGVYLPRFKSYFMYSNERNLIFAVEIDVNYDIDFDIDTIYLRLYTNAYYQSIRADATEDYLYCSGKTIQNNNDLVAIQNEYLNYKTKLGYTTLYINGYLVNTINPSLIKSGDTIEFVYDSSVKRVVTFNISNLPVFTSILDNKYKYLLHHLDQTNDTIDYQDDIDIDIIKIESDNSYKGRYYPRNNQDAHRMVTHRDYSICTDYVNFIGQSLIDSLGSDSFNIRDLYIQVKIRNAGYYRPLIFDNQRIFELYKLPDDKILQALTGVNANIPLWRAEVLENAAYTKLMRVPCDQVTLPLVQEAYGYNGITKVVADTPQKTFLFSQRQCVNVPYSLALNSTAYEYDSEGNLLGYYYHPEGTEYLCQSNLTRMVEQISGKGSYQPDVRFGIDNIPLPEYDNYRVYMCYLVFGGPNNEWVDITGEDLYRVENNTLIWNESEFGQFLMVRTDRDFLAYDVELELTGGVFYFTLSELEDRGQGVKEYTLPVPLGELDIFLNGKSLIKDLDYKLEFPKVTLLNQRHLIQPADTVKQKIHVRFTGFCNPDLTTDSVDDFGFIEHGVFSNNNRYDIRDDKVLRITCNGQLKHRNDIVFSELHSGISVVNPINGQPYQIKDIVVPLKELVDENTYSLRDKSLQIDKTVSDYLSVYLPQPERNQASSIPERYQLYSPFISRIIYAMKNDMITAQQLSVVNSDMQVIELCRSFEPLLDIDPISERFSVDYRYVIIHPHTLNATVDLTIDQYRFLIRVVKLYGNNHIELSPFVTFTS